MLHLYTQGSVEIAGQEYPANAEYEMDECGPSVVSVVALKQVCGEGGWWYDRNGNPQRGPHFERLDVTGWVDLKVWATEIVAYNDYIEHIAARHRVETARGEWAAARGGDTELAGERCRQPR